MSTVRFMFCQYTLISHCHGPIQYLTKPELTIPCRTLLYFASIMSPTSLHVPKSLYDSRLYKTIVIMRGCILAAILGFYSVYIQHSALCSVYSLYSGIEAVKSIVTLVSHSCRPGIKSLHATAGPLGSSRLRAPHPLSLLFSI